MLICYGIVYARNFVIYGKEGRLIFDKKATYNMSDLKSPSLRFLGEKS